MGIAEHNAFQLVQLFLLLVLLFRILLGAPFTALFLGKWLCVGTFSVLGLMWASDQIMTIYLAGIGMLCVVLIWHDLWPDNRRVGKLEFAGGSLALFVYGGFGWDFLVSQHLMVYFHTWGAVGSLLAAALLRQFALEFGLRSSKKMGGLSLVGYVLALLGGMLSWTAWGFELGAIVLLSAFLLLGYCARGNATK